MNQQDVPAPPVRAEPASDQPTPPGPELTPALMALARRLQAVLVPVEPRPAFLAQLAEQLAAAQPKAEAAARQRDQRLMWLAGVGGALYLVGLGFVSWRAAQAVGGRLAARGARPAGAPTAT